MSVKHHKITVKQRESSLMLKVRKRINNILPDSSFTKVIFYLLCSNKIFIYLDFMQFILSVLYVQNNFKIKAVIFNSIFK